MELYLIRHAQSLNNFLPECDRVADPPLTELWHEQCVYLAKRMDALELTRVFTSPFLRTLQPTDHIVQSLGVTPAVRVDLHEKGGCVSGPSPDSFVGQPGMTQSQIRSQFPGFSIPEQIDGEGWWRSRPLETDEVARQRAARLMNQAVTESAGVDKRVAWVMHGDFKRLFLEQIHAEPLDIPYNASVTRVVMTPEGCRLADYNRVDHLPDELLTS